MKSNTKTTTAKLYTIPTELTTKLEELSTVLGISMSKLVTEGIRYVTARPDYQRLVLENKRLEKEQNQVPF